MRSDFSTMIRVIEGFQSRPQTVQPLDRFPRKIQAQNLLHKTTLPRGQKNALLTLEERSSKLGYGEKSVETLLAIDTVQRALKAEYELSAQDDFFDLEGYVIAFKSADLPVGVYSVTTDGWGFCKEFPESFQADSLGVQKEFATGSGIISVATNLDAAENWKGTHGYRRAMVRSTSVIYDAYLRMQALGMIGTVFAGFIPSATRGLLESDGVTRHHMFAATYAYPREH